MRMTACALVVIALGIAAPASAQREQVLQVEVAGVSKVLTPAKAPYTNGGLVVPAEPLTPGVVPRVSQFRIRAWSEAAVGGRGGGVRVVVSAIQAQQREEQIASVLVGMDRAVEIAAPEQFNARRLTIRVGNPASLFRSATRPAAPVPAPPPATWRTEPYRGDVPTDPGMRPWPPPPRGSR